MMSLQLRNNRIIQTFLCTVVVIFCCGCSNRPDNVLSDAKTVDILTDMYLADAYISKNEYEFSTDSAKKGLRQSILKRHGVSQRELDHTLEWYGLHFDQYVALYEKVDRKIVEREKVYKKHKNSLDEQGDVNNLWPHPRVIRLSPVSMRDGLSFELDRSKLAKGDRLLWNFRLVNDNANLQVFIAAEYNDNYTYSLSRDVSVSGKNEIEFVTDTAKTLRRIYGYIRPKGSYSAWIDSISIQSAGFDRNKYQRLNVQTIFSPTDKKAIVQSQNSMESNINVMADDDSSLPASMGRAYIRRPGQAQPNIVR